ncbi:MAG: tetratricopeptide repeat protein [Candidatus Poribacteria bacterium]|nr:tetratricopeptide repeat protein [Candidatus Poribacteria bacterium]
MHWKIRLILMIGLTVFLFATPSQAIDQKLVEKAEAEFVKGQEAYERWQETDRERDANRAKEQYNRCLENNPNSLHRRKIRLHLLSMENREAGHLLEMAVEEFIDGYYVRAWGLLDQVEEKAPNWAEPGFWRGAICQSLDADKYYDETGKASEAHWRGATSLAEARFRLAELYWIQGQKKEALTEAKAAVKQVPGWIPPLLLSGIIHQALGDSQARKFFAEVIKLAPQNSDLIKLANEWRKRTLPLPIKSPALPEKQFDLQKAMIGRFFTEYGPDVSEQMENRKVLQQLQKIAAAIYKQDRSTIPQPQVRLLASQTPNAWAVPPNTLFVTLGLAKFVKEHEELNQIENDIFAFVLAHEWTHILQHDYERALTTYTQHQKMKKSKAEQAPPWSRLQSILGYFSELNADKQGMLYVYYAGYVPSAALRWFEARKISRQHPEPDLPLIPPIDGSYHPTSTERRQELRDFVASELHPAYYAFEHGVRAFNAYQGALKQKNLENAYQHLQKAIRAFEMYQMRFPHDVAVLENLSKTYFLHGVLLYPRHWWDPLRLQHDVRRKPELDPFKAIPASKEKAFDEWGKALSWARLLLDRNPFSPDAYQVFGDVALLKESYDKAENEYQKGLELDPTHSGILNNLGVLYALRGELPEAKAHFEQALESGSETAKHNRDKIQ